MIAIDPESKKPAFALISRHQPNAILLDQLPLNPIAKWYSLFKENEIGTLIIESQYLDRSKSPQSLLTLTMSAGMLIGIAKLLNIKIITVSPSTWQSAMLGKGNRKTLKQLSVMRASSELETNVNDHIADAYNMLQWYRTFEKQSSTAKSNHRRSLCH